MKIPLKNPNTGEIRQVKVGFSWTLLLFSGFFGIPLFFRGLPGWGLLMLVLSLSHPVVAALHPLLGISWTDLGAVQGIIGAIQLALCIYLGFNGNKLTAKDYLREGWTVLDRNSPVAKVAASRWRLAM
jgi:hypothetical protein